MARVSFKGLKRVLIAIGWVFVFVFIAGVTAYGLDVLVPEWGGQRWFIARNGMFQLIGFGLATLVVGRLLNRYSWERMGWHTDPSHGGIFLRLLRGTGLGALMAAIAVALAFAFDGAQVRVLFDWGFWLSVSLPLAAGLLAAALSEELMFRGYPLRRLADGIGALPAMLLVTLGFALAHAANPNVSKLALLNIFLAGVWLSFAFFSTGGMLFAWGAHFGWNAALAIAFDAPVSGYKFQVPMVEYTPGRHAWVDGGPFGPEGGIVTTIVLFAGTLAVIGKRVKQPRTWLAG
ncbi:MAG TPA: CPBP family intramembrane glutamic endopeptidase [Gemmatimonadales bacterium]|nr:CPBP family intramembrane glutamic endopeptidase [Gemmatimonadales bacterium]